MSPVPSKPVTPKLIIHGGAGSALDGGKGVEAVRAALQAVIEVVYPQLQQGIPAQSAVLQACQQLEDDPLFNAGTGSVLQSDGQIRMSAALMEGHSKSFSGVINISRVQHPIQLAAALQSSRDRVVAESGAMELARELNLPIYNPMTARRLQEWLALSQSERQDRFLTSVAMGTVGAVALDQQGHLAVATSTGGRGFERIGRVSDSATPAGTYADPFGAISCTGVGEDILDEGLATRIVVRVADGLSLAAALDKTFAEAQARKREFGVIGIAHTGEIGWRTTTDVLLAAYHDGEAMGLTI